MIGVRCDIWFLQILISIRIAWQLIKTLHSQEHDDVITWKHFPRYWPFVRGIHRSPVNYPHQGQWRGALMCFFICVWINGRVNNREAGDLRRYHAHCGVIVMKKKLDANPSLALVSFDNFTAAFVTSQGFVALCASIHYSSVIQSLNQNSIPYQNAGAWY